MSIDETLRRLGDRLDAIHRRLEELEDPGDIEAAHSEADNLLMDAVKLLGRPDIATAFDGIPKWYA